MARRRDVLAVVQAGGKGGRMDVLTRERAKPALPPEVMGRYLAALIDGVTLDWLVRRDDKSARQVLDLMAQQIDEVMLLPASASA